ncbi:MAG: glutamate 5-kinase [Bordetella sp.]|nr:MAG: glutamate 5-kinase [Bordetella sp.]
MNSKISAIASANRLVIKVGSSLVTNEGRGIDRTVFDNWAHQIAFLHNQNKQIILISSGAIAEGIVRLGWSTRPKTMHELQAAASVGQMGLCEAYEAAFSKYNLRTAQILLTHEDLTNKFRYLNARNTLFSLLRLGVIPIINENDTVVTDEIRLGDNDTLGALVTNLIEANAFIILTDQQGLYDSDPRKNPSAKLILHAKANDPALEVMAGSSGTNIGTGGMLTKILAARQAISGGAITIIASGREDRILIRLSQGELIGTELRSAGELVFVEHKKWLIDHFQLQG